MALLVRPDLFLSWWALGGHLVSWGGLWAADTTLLAFSIAVGALFINTFINEQYSLPADILLHYLPLALLIRRPWIVWDSEPAIYLAFAYLVYRQFDFGAIGKSYQFPQDAWLNHQYRDVPHSPESEPESEPHPGQS